MKKIFTIGVIALALLGITGCSVLSRDDVEGMVKLKTECEDAGGVFTTWNTDFNGWNYECDLSTYPEKEN